MEFLVTIKPVVASETLQRKKNHLVMEAFQLIYTRYQNEMVGYLLFDAFKIW